jgi:hypothetical protein
MTGASHDSATDGDSDDLFFLATGPLAAILIGMALVPLRGFTVASNFTFVFVVLTIVVAEFGGRRAAFATAVASTLSLDFFLTEPYLRLSIASKHDVIAFCGLAVCGAVAATLASERGRRQQASKVSRAHLDLLHASVLEMSETGSVGGLERLLDALHKTVAVPAVAVWDAKGRLLASSGDAASRTPPRDVLGPEELLVVLPAPHRILPPEGIRILLRVGTRPVGSLDIWGQGTPLSGDAPRLLSDVAALIGARLARAESR